MGNVTNIVGNFFLFLFLGKLVWFSLRRRKNLTGRRAGRIAWNPPLIRRVPQLIGTNSHNNVINADLRAWLVGIYNWGDSDRISGAGL